MVKVLSGDNVIREKIYYVNQEISNKIKNQNNVTVYKIT